MNLGFWPRITFWELSVGASNACYSRLSATGWALLSLEGLACWSVGANKGLLFSHSFFHLLRGSLPPLNYPLLPSLSMVGLCFFRPSETPRVRESLLIKFSSEIGCGIHQCSVRPTVDILPSRGLYTSEWLSGQAGGRNDESRR